ncbi:hypothetical protein [Paraburkholderia phenazinium]|jgi:hypothetical protein|uniref:hypothetical protein n=1 Tax=Paraburkholderia phenazinium TaxID=60549 RepID=UPI00158C739C|nr:hypothetical protein [Paraburkholderia phenazinium]
MRTIKNTSSALLLGLAGLLFAGNIYADTPENPCDSPFRIYFGNGIHNGPTDWIASRQELAAAIGPKFHGIPITYGNAYNPSGGFMSDLATVFAQKMSEDPSLTWTLLARVFLGETTGIGNAELTAIQNIITNVENKSTQTLKQEFENDYAYVDQKVVSQVAAFTDDIVNHSRRVLVVAHSQGTLYGNASYKVLYTNPAIQAGNFGVVDVASATNYVAGGGPYVTSNSDVVIGALRTIIAPDTLPSNVSIPFNVGDVSGHTFIATYMNPTYASRSRIVSMTLSSLNSLVEPTSSYDYVIHLDVIKVGEDGTGIQSAAGPGTGPTYVPTRLCDSYTAAFGYCSRNTLPYIRDASGRTYDPDQSPDFDSVAQAVIARLAPYAPETNEIDSSINRLITARWPILSYIATRGFDQYGHIILPWDIYSRDYDQEGHLLQTYPVSMGKDYFLNTTPHPTYTSMPTTQSVMSSQLVVPLETSAHELTGKVSFEFGDGEPYEASSVPIPLLDTSYRLRVCKVSSKT